MGTYEMQTSNEAAVPILLKEDVMQLLTTTLDHCYIINGEECRRQIRGIPMGISPSLQLANLYCYVVEREFVMRTPSSSWLNCRYLDDLFVVDPITSEEEYGMSYATSSEGKDVVYVGIRIYVKDGDQNYAIGQGRRISFPQSALPFYRLCLLQCTAGRCSHWEVCRRSTILLNDG